MTSSAKTNARTGRLGRSGQHQIGQDRSANNTGAPPEVNTLLSKLDCVKRSGKGWSARCPGHDDRQASLSVTIGDDGRILAHCFAGCAIGDVLGALGLGLADLFARRLDNTSPERRRELREAARHAGWCAALGVLVREATVVRIAAFAVLRGSLTAADAHRVSVAIDRIDAAREVLQ